MNVDLKNVLAWVFGAIIMILLTMISWFGNRIIQGQDKMNDTLTTILVHQQDLDRRATVNENEINDIKESLKEVQKELNSFPIN